MTHVPEQELRDDAPGAFGAIEEGTVGWSGEAATTDFEPGALALVRVTLRRGRTAGAPVEGDEADGTQILARLPFGEEAREAGTRCLVAFPGGDIQTPGAAVLLRYIEPPAADMTSTKLVLDYGTRDIAIRGGTITFELASGVKIELRDNRLSLFGPLGNEVRLDQIGQILLGGDNAALGVELPSGPPGYAPSLTVKAKAF